MPLLRRVRVVSRGVAAWNANRNGVKRHATEAQGVINLLGPRLTGQPGGGLGEYGWWDEHFTFVVLRFTFVGARNGVPVGLSRTFITFYDFDTGVERFDGSRTQVECAQVRGVSALRTSLASEVVQHSEGAFLQGLPAGGDMRQS